MNTRALENIGLALIVLRDCLQLYRNILLGRARLDLKVFVDDLREAGLSILFRLTVVAIIVGLVIGVQTENVLGEVNVPGLLLGAIGLAIIKHFAPLLVGLFVAGRSGIALAVRIGSMVLNREADGLIVSGINPIHYTVGPMLLAMLLMSFALAVWTDLIVLATAALWLWLQAGIPWSLFQDSLKGMLDAGDLLISVIKPLLFALLIALIAAVNGCRVSRHVESVSRAASRTMISAIAAIQLTSLLFVLAFGG